MLNRAITYFAFDLMDHFGWMKSGNAKTNEEYSPSLNAEQPVELKTGESQPHKCRNA